MRKFNDINCKVIHSPGLKIYFTVQDGSNRKPQIFNLLPELLNCALVTDVEP